MKEFFDILKDKFGFNSISDEKYIENQKNIDSFSKLKFSSYEDDFELRKENLKYKTVRYMLVIFLAFLLSIFLLYLMHFKGEIIWIFVYILSLMVGYLFIRYYIFKFPRMCLILFPLIFIVPLIHIFSLFNLDVCSLKCALFLVSTFLAFISATLYLLLPKYIRGEISESVSLLLTIIAIFSKIQPFDNYIFFNLILVEIGVNLSFVELTHKFVKNEDIITAEKYFREELLSSNPSYEKLRQCYGKGGASYKEKILSNEKFLRIIEQEENIN